VLDFIIRKLILAHFFEVELTSTEHSIAREAVKLKYARALRQSLAFLAMPTLGQPEAYIGNAGSLFNETGELINDGTHDFLTAFGAALTGWVAKHTA